MLLVLSSEYQLQPIREGDSSLMKAFAQEGFMGKKLQTLGRVRKAKKLLHISDIVKCDWVTIDRSILGDTMGGRSTHIFPQEMLTRADLRLWDKAMERLGGAVWRMVQGIDRYMHPVQSY